MQAERYAAAAVAFRDMLAELDLPPDSLQSSEQQSELGRRGAMLATAGLQWEEQIGPLLTWQEAASLIGTVQTRQGINDLAQRGRLLALRSRGGRMLYPLVQFKNGKPLASLPTVLGAFRSADVDAWAVASWLVTPQEELDGQTPAAWLKAGGDSERAVTAAQRVAARLER